MNNTIDLIQSITVRIVIRENVKTSSGIFYIHDDDSRFVYVITSRHNIEELPNTPYQTSDIKIIWKNNDGSIEYKINIAEISYLPYEVCEATLNKGDDKDIALLRINKEEVEKYNIKILRYSLINSSYLQSYYNIIMIGYPEYLVNTGVPRLFPQHCKFSGNNGNFIKLDIKSRKSDPEFAEDKLEGYSGSGIFVEVDGTIILAGIFKEIVDGENGRYDFYQAVNLKAIGDLFNMFELRKPCLIEGIYISKVFEFNSTDYQTRELEGVLGVEAKLIDYILAGIKNIILLGGGGAGKTTELKFLFNSLIYLEYNPYFLNYSELENDITHSLSNKYPNWRTTNQNKSVIIIDGLDQLHRHSFWISKLKAYVSQADALQVVVASRINFYISESDIYPVPTLNGWEEVILKNLNEDGKKFYLDKKYNTLGKSIYLKIETLNLLPLCSTFFWLVKISIIIYESLEKNIKRLEVLEKLYNESIKYDLNRVDFESIELFDAEKLQKDLIELAFEFTKTGVSEKEFDKEFKNELEAFKILSFINLKDKKRVCFTDIRFQNFLTAKHLERLTDKEIIQIVVESDEIKEFWKDTMDLFFEIFVDRKEKIKSLML